MDMFDKIEFVLKNHTVLSEEDSVWLKKIWNNRYYGTPTSVHVIHDITILYYEAVGIKKHLDFSKISATTTT